MTERDTPDLSGWIAALAPELGLDPALIDVPTVLALAGEVARAVARPAAPVTAFAVALAAGRAGGDLDAVRAAAAKAAALARAWTADQPD